MTKQGFHKRIVWIVMLAGITFSKAYAQRLMDSTGKKIDSFAKSNAAIDSALNYRSPHKASVRSAILPGWGQIYNKSYWKLPIIYGALGVTAYVFTDNLKTYKELKFAYAARYKASLPPNDGRPNNPGPYQDSTDFFKLKPIFQRIYITSIKQSRDEFRRNVDYSVLVFALFWGLNVIDASVDAHLKSFDVSPDLGLRFKAGHSDIARTNGFSIILFRK